MSDAERNLTEALREFAAAGPRQASDRVEQAVRAEFRRRRRDRRIRLAALALSAAVAAAACVVLMVRSHVPAPAAPRAVAIVKPTRTETTHVTQSVASLAKPPERPAQTSSSVPVGRRNRLPHLDARVQHAAGHPFTAGPFVPLPYGDPSLLNDSVAVVRIELPRSALRYAGYIVPPDRGNDLVQADVVLGADGLAHAMRVVGYQQ